jgi:hypothetical protein
MNRRGNQPAASRRSIKENNHMRLARKLTLLAMAAMSLAALAAPQASAQEPLTHNQTPELQARVEPPATNGALCPAVAPSPAPVPGPLATSGGCRVHASGANIVLRMHTFGIESTDSTCNTEFDARLDGSGEGYLTHAELTQGTQGTCTRRPCSFEGPNTEGRAWSTYMRENAATPHETITVLFCLWNLSTMTDYHCEVSIPFTETEGGVSTNHRYNFVANDLPCHGNPNPRGEITGTWNTEMVLGTNQENESEQQIEVNHI